MTASVPVVLERDNVNDEAVTLVRWFARHGEWVETGALLAEIETSKANVEVHAPAAGYLAREFPEGAEVPVMSAIGRILADAPGSELPSTVASTVSARPASAWENNETPATREVKTWDTSGRVPATGLSPEFRASTHYRQRFSPLAARMMEAHGLTAADFAGLSLVRKQDVLDRLSPPLPDMDIPAAPASTQEASGPIAQPYREVSLSKMKRREVAALAAGVRNSLSSAVSVACFTRGLRRTVETRMPEGNASAVIVYEVSRLLRKYPSLNAAFRGGRMLEYEQINIGFAMDDGRGLKVAVLSECDTRSLHDVAAQLRELTVAYLSDKLTPAQIASPTFTISDLSGAGVSGFLPLISENQGAILGVSAEQFAPDAAYGAYTLTLTFDHQLTNGRTAALFLGDLKERLQGYEQTVHEASRAVACSRCGRTGPELTASNHFLLRSAIPEGYICTLCASGY